VTTFTVKAGGRAYTRGVKKIQLGAVAMTAFLCAACAMGGQPDTSAPTPAPLVASSAPAAPTSAPAAATIAPVPATVAQPTVAPAATGAQVAEGDVRKVGDALLALNSFSMHGQLKEDDGSTVDWLMEFVKPDRQHTRISTSGHTIESITIGSTDYVKIGSTWSKSGLGSDQGNQILPISNPDDLAQSFKQSPSNGDTMVKGSTDSVDGAQCQVWTIASTDGEQTSACIGLSDNLPRRITTPGGDLYFSDFNAPLKIEAPI
jgi:hypothetical protein